MPKQGRQSIVWQVDRMLHAVIGTICAVLILLTVVFTCYTVVMRYVFLSPPFWGDTVALFANTWMVMLALSLSVRTRGQIAMQALYTKVSPAFAFSLEFIWTVIILAFGIFLLWFGTITAATVPGQYWELGELPKMYPMMIMPISGFLVALAAVAVLVEDWIRLRRGDLSVGNNS